MSSRSLGLYVPGLRAVDPLQSSDPAVFAQQCADVGAVVSNDGGIPHCVISRAGTLPNDPEGLNFFQNQFPPGFNPNVPAVPGAVSVASYIQDPSKGGCPVIDASINKCAYGNGNIIGCSELIECDWLTKAGHSPAPLVGGGYANPNPVTPGATPVPILKTSPSAGINQDVMKAVTQPAGSSGNPAPSGSSSSSSSSSTSTFDIGGFLQQQSVGSIPNWILIGGAAAVIIFFAVKR